MNIDRFIINDLNRWRTQEGRKPLILKGARQIGKTSTTLDFGKQFFKNTLHLNFLAMPKAIKLFSEAQDLSPLNLLNQIEALVHKKIDPKNDLLFFDEIQESPEALLSLKFFKEQMPELAIISAGSYLGIMKNEKAYPVGSVEFLEMHPLSFHEFLNADAPILLKILNENQHISLPIHDELNRAFLIYTYLGGMPEVVSSYLKNKDFSLARKIQLQLLEGQQSDFTKHAGTINSTHLTTIYNNIATQLHLAHDNTLNKYKFQNVLSGKKGFLPLQGPIDWLIKSKLIIQVPIVNKSGHPLKAFCQENSFKLLYADTGLLLASLDLAEYSFITGEELSSYKGYLAENAVAAILAKQNKQIYSWREGMAEVEFLINHNNQIIPIEVKSSAKFRQSKSLESYLTRYTPKKSLQLSFRPESKSATSGIHYLPFYRLQHYLENPNKVS